MAIRIVLLLALGLALYNLFLAELARREYDAAIEPAESWRAHGQVLMPPHGRPPVGTVILLHGFGGSPFDVKPLAAPLAERGFRVVAPLTPGQGRDVHAYRRGELTPETTLRWLRGIVRQETRRAGGVKPHLVGFSMGGSLATVIAAEDLVDRVALLAPFYALPTADGLLHTTAKVVAPAVPVIPKPYRGNIADPSIYEQYFPGTWFISLDAVLRLEELAELARMAAPNITRPTLLLGSRNDFAASFDTAEELFRGNPHVEIHEFPKSDHILLYDYDRQEVIRLVGEFLSAK